MNQYRLRTIKDIFEQVPEDRIEACMSDITQMLLQAKAIQNLGRVAAEMQGSDPDTAVDMQEEFVWTDDGDSEVRHHFNIVSKEI